MVPGTVLLPLDVNADRKWLANFLITGFVRIVGSKQEFDLDEIAGDLCALPEAEFEVAYE